MFFALAGEKMKYVISKSGDYHNLVHINPYYSDVTLTRAMSKRPLGAFRLKRNIKNSEEEGESGFRVFFCFFSSSLSPPRKTVRTYVFAREEYGPVDLKV